MARVTVEDCVKIIPNRFELSLIAGKRAKEILSGSPSTISKKNEKYTVTALREIGEGLIDVEKVRDNILCDLKNKKVINYVNQKPEAFAKSEDEELIEESIIDEEELDLDEELDEDEEEDDIELGEDLGDDEE